MKGVQLFTFEGNMGDIFSWASYQSLIKETLNTIVEFRRAEMRDFYQKTQRRNFDNKFLSEINQCDFFAISGGMFFDVRWENSHTGTTLDFSDEFIEGIKVPVFISGTGYYEPICENSLASTYKAHGKFERFISNISKRTNWHITIRNDGSYERIVSRYGDDFASLFKEIPDNGFYFDKYITPYEFDEARQTIGFSIGNDSFTTDEAAVADISKLNDGIAKSVQLLVEQGKRIIFFMHIPHDIEVVSQILQSVGTEGFRRNVILAPYDTTGINAGKQITSYYKACDAVVAMRLHANIISIQNFIPTIGLVAKGMVNGDRISALYSKLGLKDYVLYTDRDDNCLDKHIVDKTTKLLEDPHLCIELESKAMECILQQRDAYINELREFFTLNKLMKT